MEIRPMHPEERPLAARVIASGMAENPIHLAVHGPDREERLRSLELSFGAILRATERPALVVSEGGEILGAAVWGPPGACPLSGERKETLAAETETLPPAVRERFLAWRAAWGANDPSDEAHWHLGPFTVRSDLRGEGLGTALLNAFLDLVDDAGFAYLETDTERNSRYYERFGFTTVGWSEVLDVLCWFMSRR